MGFLPPCLLADLHCVVILHLFLKSPLWWETEVLLQLMLVYGA